MKDVIVYYTTRSRFARDLWACSLSWKAGKSTAICFGAVCLLPDRVEISRMLLL